MSEFEPERDVNQHSLSDSRARIVLTSGGVYQRLRWFFLFFFADPAKLLRFAMTGGLAALVQLAVLRALTADHWGALVANATGMIVAAQVNFTLSSAFTWRDRWVRAGWSRRWSMYQLTILSSALVNMLVFIVARLFVSQLLAAVAGILVAATLNFAAGDRLIFRIPLPGRPHHLLDMDADDDVAAEVRKLLQQTHNPADEPTADEKLATSTRLDERLNAPRDHR